MSSQKSRNSSVHIKDILGQEGLRMHALKLPIFGTMHLLAALTRTKQDALRAKLEAFVSYVHNGEKKVNSSLFEMQCEVAKVLGDWEVADAQHDVRTLSVLARVLGVRVELYIIGRHGGLSCQRFGHMGKSIARIFASDDAFFVLEKIQHALNKSTKGLYANRKVSEQTDCTFGIELNKSYEIAHDIDSSKTVASYGEISTELSQVDAQTVAPTFRRNKLRASLAYNLLQHQSAPQPPVLADLINAQLAAKVHHARTPVTGSLKFYNEQKEYGFIVLQDSTEIFVHKADFIKCGIATQLLAQFKRFYDIRLSFDVLEYCAKGKWNDKAVNITVDELRPAF